MKNKLFLLFCSAFIGFAGLQQVIAQESCPTGTDIHIANDISSSVDSREFHQEIIGV